MTILLYLPHPAGHQKSNANKARRWKEQLNQRRKNMKQTALKNTVISPLVQVPNTSKQIYGLKQPGKLDSYIRAKLQWDLNLAWNINEMGITQWTAIRLNNAEINSKSSAIVIWSRLYPFDSDNDLQSKCTATWIWQCSFDKPGARCNHKKKNNRAFTPPKQTKSSNNSPNKLRPELKPLSMTSVSKAETFLTWKLFHPATPSAAISLPRSPSTWTNLGFFHRARGWNHLLDLLLLGFKTQGPHGNFQLFGIDFTWNVGESGYMGRFSAFQSICFKGRDVLQRKSNKNHTHANTDTNQTCVCFTFFPLSNKIH